MEVEEVQRGLEFDFTVGCLHCIVVFVGGLVRGRKGWKGGG